MTEQRLLLDTRGSHSTTHPRKHTHTLTWENPSSPPSTSPRRRFYFHRDVPPDCHIYQPLFSIFLRNGRITSTGYWTVLQFSFVRYINSSDWIFCFILIKRNKIPAVRIFGGLHSAEWNNNLFCYHHRGPLNMLIESVIQLGNSHDNATPAVRHTEVMRLVDGPKEQ